jgi:hypothetical protein
MRMLTLLSNLCRDAERLERCWDFLPRAYGVFDLLRMVKSSLSLLPLTPSYSTIFAAPDDPDAADSALSVDKKESVDKNDGVVSPSTSSSGVVNVVTRKPFTVEDFRPQLIKMYYRMKAQQELKEKQRVGQEELAQRREAEAQEEQQRRELEELRREERLIIERKEKARDDMNEREGLLSALVPAGGPTTPVKNESGRRKNEAARKAEEKGKQPTTPKKKENFISIFDGK